MNIELLVYGSLLNTKSASIGIGRSIDINDYRDIKLSGYCLAFDVLEGVIIHGKEMQVCFLNLSKKTNAILQVKSLSVSRKELQRLIPREKNYLLTQINKSCTPCHEKEVFTFIGKSKYMASNTEQAIILKDYLKKVKANIHRFNGTFAQHFLSDLEGASKDSAIISGEYRFMSSLQNSMTDCIVNQ